MIEVEDSPESLEIAKQEIINIINKINWNVQKIKEQTAGLDLIAIPNQHGILDLKCNYHTLLVQFYQPTHDSESYILFGVVDGLFDLNGNADKQYIPKFLDRIRLKLAKNINGNHGWIDIENRDKFYITEEVVQIWLNKFFKVSIPDIKL